MNGPVAIQITSFEDETHGLTRVGVDGGFHRFELLGRTADRIMRSEGIEVSDQEMGLADEGTEHVEDDGHLLRGMESPA